MGKIQRVVNHTLSGSTEYFNYVSVSPKPFMIQLKYSATVAPEIWLEVSTGISGQWEQIENSNIILDTADTSISIRDPYGYPDGTVLRIGTKDGTGTIEQINYNI